MVKLKWILFFVLSTVAFQTKAQVGINTAAPLSTLDINGNLSVKEIGIPTPYYGGPSGNWVVINDGVYLSLTPTSGSPEFALPKASNVPGRIYILRNISDTDNVKLFAVSCNLFAKNSNTATPQPLIMPPTTGLKTIIVISDGANWTYIF